MFARVKLLNRYSEPLLYAVPSTLVHTPLVGKIVQVPLRATVVPAVVIDLLARRPSNASFTVKEIIGLEPFPDDQRYTHFIEQISRYYQVDPLHFIARIRLFLEQVEPRSRPRAAPVHHQPAPVILTEQQETVCSFMCQAIEKKEYTPTLLHGVTGSGKTEVYKRLIMAALQHTTSAILMLPEVTLALRFEQLLRQQLPADVEMFGFHSSSSTSDKRALWQRLLEKKPTLIIGVHLPILLPIAHLGLIIVDEEHEAGYQEKKHPKINSREIALWRAQLNALPILLGSATPSIPSLYNVHTKNWHFFQLTQRFGGTLPTIETVYLTDKKERRSFWISQKLEDAIKDRLAHKEQIIIFINRRGFSFFIQCKACSFTFSCASCSVSLTFHSDGSLVCHYCGFSMQQPRSCPPCKAGQDQFLKKGIGTQQVVAILEQLFPHARIGRADLDVTSKKKIWKQMITDFSDGALDILVGTQTITKGFHFPRVTLVGVIWADLNLNFPVYNASETTLQQLIQVAGRAGRAGSRSQVIIQAMAEHPLFNYLNEVDYISFYHQEIVSRAAVRYPPCVRFAEIELKNISEMNIEKEAGCMVQELCAYQTKNNYSVSILGPTKPPVYKIKNDHIRKIYLKATNMHEIINLYACLDKKKYTSKLFFTPNPLN